MKHGNAEGRLGHFIACEPAHARYLLELGPQSPPRRHVHLVRTVRLAGPPRRVRRWRRWRRAVVVNRQGLATTYAHRAM